MDRQQAIKCAKHAKQLFGTSNSGYSCIALQAAVNDITGFCAIFTNNPLCIMYSSHAKAGRRGGFHDHPRWDEYDPLLCRNIRHEKLHAFVEYLANMSDVTFDLLYAEAVEQARIVANWD